jgi:hypothetical protein
MLNDTCVNMEFCDTVNDELPLLYHNSGGTSGNLVAFDFETHFCLSLATLT